jgi:invasion protein IalB
MSHRDGIATGLGRGVLAGGATLALIFSVALGGGLAQAQDAKKDAAPAPAAKDAKAAPAGKQSAWVKLCENAPLVKKDKDGKDVKEEKNICLTHHERLDGNSGMVLVSAAIRHVDGAEHDHLMIMVPLGMALPPGIKAAVYTKEQWEKAAKNEKIDDKDLKPIDLKYSLCHSSGCTAETEATKEIVEQMKAGGGIMVLAMNAQAQPIGFPVPLDGFTDAFAGKPVDNVEYKKARGQLMAQIRQRQQEAYEKFRAEKAKDLPPKPGEDAKPAEKK